MKIVVAPNALKGSLSAYNAALAIRTGIQRVIPHADVFLLPVADGGDGLQAVLKESLNARYIDVVATGPLGTPISTSFLYSDTQCLAVIEMASIAGLERVPAEQRNPMLTTSFGVGEVMKKALDAGARHLIIGIGGSATNDAGIGMASALGVKFFNYHRHPLEPVGKSLIELAYIDKTGMDTRLADVTLEVMCDVQNPLYGAQGAAHIYAPQKGASPAQVLLLDKGLKNIASIIFQQLGIDVHTLPGAGAAGGLGAGLHAFFGARLRPGIDIVLDLIEFDKALIDARLVITAEGKLDEQSRFGKAPTGVAQRAQQRNIPCIIIAGSIALSTSSANALGFDAAFSLCQGPVDLETAMTHSAQYLTATTEQVIRCFLLDGSNDL